MGMVIGMVRNFGLRSKMSQEQEQEQELKTMYDHAASGW